MEELLRQLLKGQQQLFSTTNRLETKFDAEIKDNKEFKTKVLETFSGFENEFKDVRQDIKKLNTKFGILAEELLEQKAEIKQFKNRIA